MKLSSGDRFKASGQQKYVWVGSWAWDAWKCVLLCYFYLVAEVFGLDFSGCDKGRVGGGFRPARLRYAGVVCGVKFSGHHEFDDRRAPGVFFWRGMLREYEGVGRAMVCAEQETFRPAL